MGDPYEEVSFDTGNLSDGEVYVVINMVSSIDGRVEVDGKSGAIGSDVDRSAMRTLRSKVDAVMVGSGTVRAETVSLTSEGKASPAPEPYAVIPTSNPDLPLSRNLKDNDPERTIVLTTSQAVNSTEADKLETLRSLAHVVECDATDDGSPNLTQGMKALRDTFHIETLLLEGGPSLNASMVSGGLVKEIFLTLSPKLLGGRQEDSLSILSGKPLEDVAAHPVQIHTSRHTSELFLRYCISYPE